MFISYQCVHVCDWLTDCCWIIWTSLTGSVEGYVSNTDFEVEVQAGENLLYPIFSCMVD